MLRLILCLVLLSSSISAQVYIKTDVKVDSSFLSPPISIHAANDSGYLIGSQASYNGKSYDAMTRISSDGTPLWSHLFRSDTASNYFGERSTRLVDNAWASYVTWFGSPGHFFVNKVDDQGNKLWTRNYFFGTNSVFHDIVGGPDSSIYLIGGGCIAGASAVVKLSASGQPLWYKSYLSNGGGARRGIINSSGNLIVTGQIQNYNLSFIEVDPNGNLLQAQRYPIGEICLARKVLEYRESGQRRYLLTVSLRLPTHAAPRDVPLLMSLDSTGQVLWSDTLGSADTYFPSGSVQDAKGDFVMYGSTTDKGSLNYANGFFAKWSKQGQYQGTYVAADSTINVTLEDGCFRNTGSILICEKDFYEGIKIHEISGPLDSICEAVPSYPVVQPYPISAVNDFAEFSYTVAERPQPFDNRVFNAKVSTICSDPILASEPESQSPTVKVYPNPASDLLKIELPLQEPGQGIFHLWNHAGQLCKTENLASPLTEIQLSGLSRGMYMFSIRLPEGQTQYGKLVLH